MLWADVEPSLWALLYDRVGLKKGDEVIHSLPAPFTTAPSWQSWVGPDGRVTAIEIDLTLAERAANNLAAWQQTRVLRADGFTFRPEQRADAIVLNAGVNHFSMAWLD